MHASVSKQMSQELGDSNILSWPPEKRLLAGRCSTPVLFLLVSLQCPELLPGVYRSMDWPGQRIAAFAYMSSCNSAPMRHCSCASLFFALLSSKTIISINTEITSMGTGSRDGDKESMFWPLLLIRKGFTKESFRLFPPSLWEFSLKPPRLHSFFPFLMNKTQWKAVKGASSQMVSWASVGYCVHKHTVKKWTC